MASLLSLTEFIGRELELTKFSDGSLNGLQVEGAPEVHLVCGAVDAGLSVIEEAARRGAQLLIVHHGLFWGGSIPIVDSHYRAVSCMIKSGLGLYAAHLPLDAHQRFGNNFGLARHLDLIDLVACGVHHGSPLAARGVNAQKLTLNDMSERLMQLPGSGELTTLAFGPAVPAKVCVMTGAAADQLYNYVADDFDTLITGEPRQFAYHFAKERKLNAIFAGHYRTETIGVRLLGEELANQFSVKFDFIDEPTGI